MDPEVEKRLRGVGELALMNDYVHDRIRDWDGQDFNEAEFDRAVEGVALDEEDLGIKRETVLKVGRWHVLERNVERRSVEGKPPTPVGCRFCETSLDPRTRLREPELEQYKSTHPEDLGWEEEPFACQDCIRSIVEQGI